MSNLSNTSTQIPHSPTLRSLAGPLIAIIVGIFMVILDSTAINVAIPELVKSFDSTLTVVQWTITGYTLAQASVIPLAGWMSDRFGAKRIFMISIALFTIGSVFCIFATTAPQLVFYRILQGLGGGMVMPIAMAMIYRISPPDKVGSMMGIMGMPILLAPALGPILSGYLVDYVNWHWIFLINLPVGVLALFLAYRLIPKLPVQSSTSFDLLGTIFGPLAFASLCYGISEGSTSWTSTKTLVGIIVGGIALVIFIFVELTRKKQPLLELRVFRSMMFTRGILTQWAMQFVMFGVIFLIPYYLQRMMGMSALEAGLWTLPQAIASGLFMPIGGRLYDRIGPRPLVVTGLSIVAIGAFLLSRITPQDEAMAFLLPRILLGMGMGMSFLSLNTFLIQSAPRDLVSRVTSLTSAMQQVITSISIAALTTLLVNRLNSHMSNGEKQFEGFAHAFSDTYLFLMGLAIIGAILGLTLRKIKVEHKSNGISSETRDQIVPLSEM